MNERIWFLQNKWLAPFMAVLLVSFSLPWLLANPDDPLWAKLIGFPFLAWILFMHSHVRIEGSVLRIGMVALWRRTIHLADIASVQAVTYRPLRDFSGWGIRMGLGEFAGTWAYTLEGNEGILVRLKSGKSLLFGTRRTQDWIFALQAAGVDASD